MEGTEFTGHVSIPDSTSKSDGLKKNDHAPTTTTTPSSDYSVSLELSRTNGTTPLAATKIVPNPTSDKSFSRVILTDWLVSPGSDEHNSKSEIVE